ncbi:MAG: VWA domain-containing protein [Spirochaetaceae bacterium]|nr:VWA domain-containing protein [Spirochaetaceae bacterium]
MPLIATGGALRFVHPEAFLLLWLLLPLAAALYLAGRARRRDARRFRAVPEQGTPASGARPLLAALILTGMALLVIGIARPGWESSPTTVERRGRDVVFVVDTSRSMLAEDLAPNRLERAKLAILDAVENLDGDRVALVAYAGSAVVKSPLTFDYGFFRMAVRQLSATSVSRGGSLLGDALRTVHDDVLDNQVREFKDVLLITDGGDHDSFPVEAAEALGQSGARILAIGLGNDTAGQPIPDLQQSGPAGAAYVEHQGEIVLSALDADLLRAVAGATPAGRYVHWATGNLDLGRLYREMIAAAPGRLLEAEAVELINERFQIFLGLALLLFAVTAAVPDRLRLPRLFVGRLGDLRRRQRTPVVQPTAAARRRSTPHQVRGAASG